MNHPINFPRRRNVRAFVAAFISYLMLAGQVAPLALAARGSSPRPAPKSETTATQPESLRAAPAPLVFAAPIITATKVDSFPDPNANGKAEPGDTITYTVTISNTGSADATAVQFSDSVDTNTTLVAGSVQTQPIATDDAYNVLGNVRIQPNAANGLLANDRDPDTGSSTGLTASGPTTTTQGGNITINADGSFSYNPLPGFTGTDTVTYTITDLGPDNTAGTGDDKTDTAVATFTVTGMIWFVNSASGTNGDGRLTSPFNCLRGPGCFDSTTTGGAADDPGDNIFLYASATAYNGGLTLLNSQKLIGQGASGTLDADAGVTLPANSDPLPTLNNNPTSPTITTTAASTNGINIATGNSNTLRGFTVGNTTGAKIASPASPPAAAFGTLTVSEVILNGSGQALNLDNGTLAATFVSISSTSSGTQGILLDQIAGSLTSTNGTTISGNATQCLLATASTANMSFGNTSCTGGTDGISLQNNSAGTRTFGTLGVSGGSGIAFLSSNGGGNTTISGAASLASAGNPVDIQNLAASTTVNFAGGATATKTTTGGAGVNLANNNATSTVTFNTLAITTSNGTGLKAATGGTINVTNAAGSSISATGIAAQVAPAIDASGVTLNANFTTVTSTNSGGAGTGITLTTVGGALVITNTNIQNPGGVGINEATSAGNNNFGTTTVNGSGSTGVNLSTNTGTITFADFDVTPDSGQRGILFQSNTGAITSTSGDIVATSNVGVEITGASSASKTPLNMQLTKVTASGSTSGIVLTNTSSSGSPGGFRVNANGGTCTTAANCTGGAITSMSNAGILLATASDVFFDRMFIQNTADSGVKGSLGVVNFSFTNGKIDNSGTGGVAQTSNIAFNTQSGGTENNLSGVVTITGNSLTNAFYHGVSIFNFNGTISNLTVSSNTLTSSTTTGGPPPASVGSGIQIVAFGSASTVANITKGTLDANKINNFPGAVGLQVQCGNVNNTAAPASTCGTAGSATNIINITNNEINKPGNGSTVKTGNEGMIALVNGVGQGNFNITGNNIQQTLGTALSSSAFGFANVTETINNNIIVANNINAAQGIGIGTSRAFGANTETPHLTASINGNNVSQVDGNGILAVARDASGHLDVTIKTNTVAAPLTGVRQGIRVDAGNTQSADDAVCLDISGNTSAPSVGQPAALGIGLRKQGTNPTVNDFGIEGMAATSTPGVEAFVNGQNPAGGGTLLISATSGFTNCSSAPAVSLDFDGPTSPGGIGTFNGNAPTTRPTTTTATAAPTGVTSRPFISPRPIAPATTTARAASTTATATTTGNTTPRGTVDPIIINGAGGTVSVNIGTLRAGDSVTITFQVTVDDPYSGPPNVSNQGTVSGTNFSNVLTDDPSIAGTANPTLTPINSINIFARDGSAAEPASGNTPLLFTVTLSNPAGASGVSVNYATATDPSPPGGKIAATGGAACDNNTVDYVTANGTVNFAAGQQVKTVSVNVCHDASGSNADETFLLNLSGAVGGTILDAQAVGTITQGSTAGTFLISELRTSGPGGAGDDFVELYNNTDTPLTVAASDASAGYGVFKMGTDCNATPVLIGTIPNGTIIPARGHYLFVGSQYGLGSYATGNTTMTSDIENDHNVAVFSTADVTAVSTATRKDAVGFDGNTGGGVCDLLREGNTLPPVSGTTTQHSFFRKECDFVAGVGCSTPGSPKDTNDNAADLMFADTQGTFISGVQQHLGAPGPENLQSPIRRDATVLTILLDNTKASSVSPNRVRDLTSNPGNNSTFGTLSIRRRVVNNSGANVTRLRFRIVEITTFPSPGGGVADLRAITSTNVSVSGVNDSGTCNTSNGNPATPCTVNVLGTTLEQPPTQPNGGGFNSSLAAGTVTLGTPLANNAAINVQFLLGVQTTGTFRFLIIVEALP
jgi:hypothetical protein